MSIVNLLKSMGEPPYAKVRFLWPALITNAYLCNMENFLEQLFAGQEYDKDNFFLIAGPCVVESEELVFDVARQVSAICKKHGIPLVFKSS